MLEPEIDLTDTIVVIGMIEPDEKVCWIESEIIQGWKWLLESCQDLLEAGYPGCVGCGGPNSIISLATRYVAASGSDFFNVNLSCLFCEIHGCGQILTRRETVSVMITSNSKHDSHNIYC